MHKEQAQKCYTPSKYSKIFKLYTKNYMKWINPFLTCISKSCHYGAKYPIFKILKAISKIFLLNEIQIIFLAYMIKQTNWDIKEKLIINNLQFIQDVVCYSNNEPEYRSLILYLLITSYSVKFYLNEDNKDVLQEANKICPNFKMIFQNWAKKHANLTKRINPKTLNKVYQTLWLETRKQEPDFNMMVDAIIQISPAYNPDKNDVKRKECAQIKRQPMKRVKNDNPIIISSRNGNQAWNTRQISNHQTDAPAFSSSALYDIAAHGKNLPNEMVLNSLNIFKEDTNQMNRSGNFLGSSFVGIPKYDIRDRENDQQICQNFILNLKEGQSQENIIIQDNNNQNDDNLNAPQTSIINLQRGMSATEKYWVQAPQDKQPN